jgi:carbon storage regulator
MLVLTRKCGEAIRIGNGVTVVLIKTARGQARIGIEAPAGVAVLREEVHARIAQANRDSAQGAALPGVNAHKQGDRT